MRPGGRGLVGTPSSLTLRAGYCWSVVAGGPSWRAGLVVGAPRVAARAVSPSPVLLARPGGAGVWRVGAEERRGVWG